MQHDSKRMHTRVRYSAMKIDVNAKLENIKLNAIWAINKGVTWCVYSQFRIAVGI